MTAITGEPQALHFTELERSPLDTVKAFFARIHETVRAVMFAPSGEQTIVPGFGQNGVLLNISVPPQLRGAVPQQTVPYNGRSNGRDFTVTVCLIHED